MDYIITVLLAEKVRLKKVHNGIINKNGTGADLYLTNIIADIDKVISNIKDGNVN